MPGRYEYGWITWLTWEFGGSGGVVVGGAGLYCTEMCDMV